MERLPARHHFRPSIGRQTDSVRYRREIEPSYQTVSGSLPPTWTHDGNVRPSTKLRTLSQLEREFARVVCAATQLRQGRTMVWKHFTSEKQTVV